VQALIDAEKVDLRTLSERNKRVQKRAYLTAHAKKKNLRKIRKRKADFKNPKRKKRKPHKSSPLMKLPIRQQETGGSQGRAGAEDY